jgi:hypothetical protein
MKTSNGKYAEASCFPGRKIIAVVRNEKIRNEICDMGFLRLRNLKNFGVSIMLINYVLRESA